MKITESKLRKIIKDVIKESNGEDAFDLDMPSETYESDPEMEILERDRFICSDQQSIDRIFNGLLNKSAYIRIDGETKSLIIDKNLLSGHILDLGRELDQGRENDKYAGTGFRFFWNKQ